VTESVVFLTSPGTCFDVIETTDFLSPFGFPANFDEFGVLDHHCMHNPQEGFVRWE